MSLGFESLSEGKVVPVHVMTAYEGGREGVKLQLHAFLTSALDETVVSFMPGQYYSREKSNR